MYFCARRKLDCLPGIQNTVEGMGKIEKPAQGLCGVEVIVHCLGEFSDELGRRVGQLVAAASLPALDQ